ncbi:hypothetical protein [Franzmannia qiaohouensis]|uniref:DUF5666 domain-containing protein n=1 Tax=Franzmannia qiaohouensis TaxID=1329370 RepID=A0ABU1HBA5_9GAMM|nr:hypothetical protein [Halomonas qiaohouensis]MDR5904743.1 hypothetical protein [Halomonas qiaohouensis]
MKRNRWALWLSPLALAWPAMATAGEGDSSGSSSSTTTVTSSSASSSSASSSSVSGGSSRSESSVSGQNASVTVNGHRLEVRNGRLRLDDVTHGEVTPMQTVTLRVVDGVATLLVDGVERLPDS